MNDGCATSSRWWTKAASPQRRDASTLPQPSLSQAVRSLELELGVQLFQGVGRGIRLSAAGEALVGPARRVLRANDEARNAITDVTELNTGTLEIAALPTLAVDPMAPLIGRFRLPVAGEQLTSHALGQQELVFIFPPDSAPAGRRSLETGSWPRVRSSSVLPAHRRACCSKSSGRGRGFAADRGGDGGAGGDRSARSRRRGRRAVAGPPCRRSDAAGGGQPSRTTCDHAQGSYVKQSVVGVVAGSLRRW